MVSLPLSTNLPGLTPASEATRRSRTYDGIQMLRFVAAFMVLVTHATFFVNSRGFPEFPRWDAGAQGVSLFFVISGFVMAISAKALVGRKNCFRYFMGSRVIRIVPLYWSINLIKIAILILVPGLILANPTTSNIIWSMLFMPSRNAEGIIEVFYGVGWTLNFEMAFYILIAFILLLRGNLVFWVTVIMPVVALLSLVRQESWWAISSFLDPIVLNFLWGVLIAHWDMQDRRLPVPLALTAIAVGGTIILFFPYFFAFELQYACVVAGLVALEPYLSRRLPRWLLLGGDASYSIYLTHPLVGVAAALVLARLSLPPLLILLGIIAICLATSAVIYLYFEKPITKSLRKKFLVRPA
jgi:exopolysaccharide production protein ExoZ